MRGLKYWIFLISAIFLCAALCAADRLNPGDLLPELTGETLSGKPITLSADGAKSAKVLVFSFTHASAGDSRLWIDRVLADAPAGGQAGGVEVFQVVELEAAPRLVRGMATSGIRKATPAQQWEHTILLYKQDAEWKSRLAVKADKYAYVALVDGKGHILWTGSGPFSENSYSALKQAIANLRL